MHSVIRGNRGADVNKTKDSGKGEEMMSVTRCRRGGVKCRRSSKCTGRKEWTSTVLGGLTGRI